MTSETDPLVTKVEEILDEGTTMLDPGERVRLRDWGDQLFTIRTARYDNERHLAIYEVEELRMEIPGSKITGVWAES